jgi:hypothetical protein
MEPRQVIEAIRAQCCGASSEVAAMLGNAVAMLSEQLYSARSHFIFELIQARHAPAPRNELECTPDRRRCRQPGAPATRGAAFDGARGRTRAVCTPARGWA